MITARVGFGEGEDAFVVGRDATLSATTELGEDPTLIIVFSSVEYDQEKMLAGVHSVSQSALVAGCSTAGEITTAGPSSKHGVAVMAIHLSNVSSFVAVGENVSADPRTAGRVVAEDVLRQAGGEIKAFMMFPDVLQGNGADIVRGTLDALGQHFPVVGGAAGDDFQFKKTYQYANGRVYSNAVVGVGLKGDFKIGVGVKHGWIPIGVPMKVTKAEGSIVHEINGKSAIKIYEDYFGPEYATDLKKEVLGKLAITYPLGVKVEGSNEFLIRDPLSVNEAGSITCAAEIPEGSEVRIMIGNREEAIRAAKLAAESAMEQIGESTPKAIIIFNCIARSKLFGEYSGEEINAIQEIVGKNVPLIGFYTYGEQAPVEGITANIEKCNSMFHNETVVICVLAD